MEKRKTIYYEFWKLKGYAENLVKTGTRTVGSNNTITTGVDTVPTATLTIPMEDLPADEIADGKEPNLSLYKIKVFYQAEGIQKYVFVGTVDSLALDYAHYTCTINLSHNVSRMREWIMPNGYVVKESSLSHVIGPNGADLGYSSTMGDDTQTYEARVNFVYRDGVENTPIEISFSSQNKLAALTEVLNNTESVHFVVDLSKEDTIILGKFGDLTPVLISPNAYYEEDCDKRNSDNFVTMLTEPVYNVDYTNHFNRAVVFCGDVAEDIMHMTLKEVYENPSLQIEGFPVGMYDNEINLQPEAEWKQKDNTDKIHNTTKINNEKKYKKYEVVAYANNDNREYYVTDQQQLNEDGVIYHTVFNFTDLYPIPELERKEDENNDDEEAVEYAITDDDRRAIVQRAYWRAIRKLKAQRPEHVWQFNSTPLPYNFQDGQKVSFYFIKKVSQRDGDCEEGDKTIVKIQRDLYMTKRTITFDEDLNEINTITLDVEIRPRDVSDAEWILRTKAQANSSNTTTESTPIPLSDSNRFNYNFHESTRDDVRNSAGDYNYSLNTSTRD